jgi:uncharacterized peroxidase-related enzyme
MTTTTTTTTPTLPADATLVTGPAEPQPWSRIGLPDESDFPPEVIELGERIREKHAVLGAAFDPESFLKLAQFSAPLGDPEQGHLPIEERELLGTVVSAENRCTGCLLHHIRAFGEAIHDQLRAHRIGINYRHVPLSSRERALADLASKLTLAPASVEDADIQRLHAAGLSDAAIYEAVVIISLTNYSNRISSGLGLRPDDDFFTSYVFGEGR